MPQQGTASLSIEVAWEICKHGEIKFVVIWSWQGCCEVNGIAKFTSIQETLIPIPNSTYLRTKLPTPQSKI